jgi:soluble calcium-activated nucleotidase 1
VILSLTAFVAIYISQGPLSPLSSTATTQLSASLNVHNSPDASFGSASASYSVGRRSAVKLSIPLKRQNSYRLALISDQDKLSRVGNSLTFASALTYATLDFPSILDDVAELKIEATTRATTVMNENGRGMESSLLFLMNGRLHTCDDRSGIVYELIGTSSSNGNSDNDKGKGNVATVTAVPRAILADGDGDSAKGFKCEWATVYDGRVIIGSIGKEFTDAVTGNPVSYVYSYFLQ